MCFDLLFAWNYNDYSSKSFFFSWVHKVCNKTKWNGTNQSGNWQLPALETRENRPEGGVHIEWILVYTSANTDFLMDYPVTNSAATEFTCVLHSSSMHQWTSDAKLHLIGMFHKAVIWLLFTISSSAENQIRQAFGLDAEPLQYAHILISPVITTPNYLYQIWQSSFVWIVRFAFSWKAWGIDHYSFRYTIPESKGVILVRSTHSSFIWDNFSPNIQKSNSRGSSCSSERCSFWILLLRLAA